MMLRWPFFSHFMVVSQFALHDGNVVLFVNGDATTQSFGWGGICGGGIVWLTEPNSACAAASNVLFESVTGSHPPPFQNPDCEPPKFISEAILFDTVTGPHAPAD
jgi:hypothetical protein